MAALGQIRKRGVLLIVVIGLALFAFIAEELVRTLGGPKEPVAGVVLGKKLTMQEFNAMVEEYQELQGGQNLSEDQLNQLRDQLWQKYVTYSLIQDEASKLGLTVTDEEIQTMLREGTNPILRNAPVFFNQQTGRFDAAQLTQFLNNYKKMEASQNAQEAAYAKQIYKVWRYFEKELRPQLLMQKYQTLLGACLLSNPVSAKMAFDGQNTESDILLATLPYTSINDNKVEVTEGDLKAKYEEVKARYEMPAETRDIKYVAYQVVPSAKDRDALIKQMAASADSLKAGANAADVVRKAQSQVSYTGLAVSRKSLPTDIAAKVDSMSVGQTVGPFETRFDNTLNVVKLIAKAEMPDSVEYQAIQVVNASPEATKKSADSIYAAVKAGAPVDSVAKKYAQDGAKQWLTSEYEQAQNLNEDNRRLLETILTLPAGDVANVSFGQANIVIKVTQRKAFVPKYTVAILKHTFDFSKDTYSAAYNKFSQFVSANTTIEDMEKNASKSGYSVRNIEYLGSDVHNVANIRGTHEALKWIFDAKEKQISPLYECGDNDYLLVAYVDKIHKKGYLSLDDVKDNLKQEVINDKKFEQLKGQLASVKSVADAKSKGASVDTLRQVTFAAPAYVRGASEPALSGAVAATAQGKMVDHVVKGNAAAYLFQVLKQGKRADAKYDEKQTESYLNTMSQQAASRFINELYRKANVEDSRYLYF